MNRALSSIIRMSAFLRKEIYEILRQPRLVFTLILGPFLILLIFGIGYRNKPQSLRTLFVVNKGSALEGQIKEYATTLGPQLVYEGTIYDKQKALNELAQGKVDLVAVAPQDAYQTILNNEPAVFTLYHREIDPFQVDYVKYFGQAYVDEVNRRVLQSITQQGQSETSTLQSDLEQARKNTSALRQAIENNNQAAANQQRFLLNQNLNGISLAVGASLGLLSGVQQTLGGSQENQATQVQKALQDIQQSSNNIGSTESKTQQLNNLTKIENDLTVLENNLKEFRSISPSVLVSPFQSETKSIAPVQPSEPDFFAPAVLALLLQHLAVTFAALSIVRERTVGTMELFRVSPLSAAETLIGKYLSYLLFSGFIAVILSLLLVFILRMPMIGSWWNFSLVVLILIFSSLSIGFVISILSQTDSQAVQFTMIILLTSVFFSGFLMSLNTLIPPVRVISWLLPTTYGIVMLRDISFRGAGINWLLLGGLFAIGFVLTLISWLLLRRMVSEPQK